MISTGTTSIRFTIIIPVYKVEKYLRKCVNSVLAQTYANYEIILVDDGSPDNCPAICDEYTIYDSPIKVIHKANGGLSDARNAGLEAAAGEYVLFIDSDDWWDDVNFLANLNSRIKAGNPDIVIFGMKKFYDGKTGFAETREPVVDDNNNDCPPDNSYLEKFMQNNAYVACAWDKAVRRSFVGGQRFVKGQLSEDIEWCCKLLMKNPRIDVIESAPYVYRQQVNTSITANVGSKNIAHILDVLKRYAGPDAKEPILNYLANQYVLLITTLMRIPPAQRKPFYNEIKSLWWLLDYTWYPYVKKVAKVKRLGFNVTSALLRLYYLAKR